jgi:beta-galactosidase
MLLPFILSLAASRTFTVKGNRFLLDGRPFRYIAGEFHYFRQHPSSWEQTIKKMATGGLNVVQTYIPWNLHEPKKGQFNFEGIADLEGWIGICRRCGMYAILRLGPYICSEWDFGGLPYWLITDGVQRLRSMDPVYIKHVDDFFSALLARIKKFIISNDGPVLMLQVENEYGAYFTCDRPYMQHLCDFIRAHLGQETVLFTTDQPHDYVLECGAIPEAAVVGLNFGVGFKSSRMFVRAGNSPPINSEFYTGWLDHWREPHQRMSTELVLQYLEDMLKFGANINFYMYAGGTNFAFWNGANGDRHHYTAAPTSYDFDAPLSESGDMTWKYIRIRDVIRNYRGRGFPEFEVWNTTKTVFPAVAFSKGVTLLDTISGVAESVVTDPEPLTFESLNTGLGFVLYETETTGGDLKLKCIHDRADILVNGKRVSIQMRNEEHNIQIEPGKLAILVESMGRLNFGFDLFDEKGLLKGVTLDGNPVMRWTMTTIPLTSTSGISFGDGLPTGVPAFYQGTFSVDDPADTFLNPSGFDKGVAFVNGFNLGRYWTVGPQLTLYVPSAILRKGENELIVFEIGQIQHVGKMTFDDQPQIDTYHQPAVVED